MALERPLKEGSVRTYQEKVGLGFPDILASEADADHDTIYAAWNGGVDTGNLRDNAVTSAKIAPDQIGPRELADNLPGSILVDGAITWAKHGQRAYARVWRAAAFTFVTGQDTVVVFDGADVNNFGNLFTLSAPDRMTVQEAGLYVIGASVEFGANPTGGGLRRTRLVLNAAGTPLAQQGLPPSSGAGQAYRAFALAGIYYAAAGDYFRLTVFHDAGVAITTTGADMLTNLWVVRVG